MNKSISSVPLRATKTYSASYCIPYAWLGTDFAVMPDSAMPSILILLNSFLGSSCAVFTMATSSYPGHRWPWAMIFFLCIKAFIENGWKTSTNKWKSPPIFLLPIKYKPQATANTDVYKIQLFTQGKPQAFTRTRSDYGKHGRRMYYFRKI